MASLYGSQRQAFECIIGNRESVLVQSARRHGKSYLSAMTAAAMMSNNDGCTVVLHTTGVRSALSFSQRVEDAVGVHIGVLKKNRFMLKLKNGAQLITRNTNNQKEEFYSKGNDSVSLVIFDEVGFMKAGLLEKYKSMHPHAVFLMTCTPTSDECVSNILKEVQVDGMRIIKLQMTEEEIRHFNQLN